MSARRSSHAISIPLARRCPVHARDRRALAWVAVLRALAFGMAPSRSVETWSLVPCAGHGSSSSTRCRWMTAGAGAGFTGIGENFAALPAPDTRRNIRRNRDRPVDSGGCLRGLVARCAAVHARRLGDDPTFAPLFVQHLIRADVSSGVRGRPPLRARLAGRGERGPPQRPAPRSALVHWLPSRPRRM